MQKDYIKLKVCYSIHTNVRTNGRNGTYRGTDGMLGRTNNTHKKHQK